MREITQIQKLSLWIFFIPLFAINLCLFITINYDLFENTILQVDQIGRSAFTIPYIDGSLSISRAQMTCCYLQMNLVMQNGFSSRTVSPVVVDAAPMPQLVMGSLLGLSFQDGVVTIRGTTGQQKWGTLKEVTERYRWLGPWGSGPRFKSLS